MRNNANIIFDKLSTLLTPPATTGVTYPLVSDEAGNISFDPTAGSAALNQYDIGVGNASNLLSGSSNFTFNNGVLTQNGANAAHVIKVATTELWRHDYDSNYAYFTSSQADGGVGRIVWKISNVGQVTIDPDGSVANSTVTFDLKKGRAALSSAKIGNSGLNEAQLFFQDNSDANGQIYYDAGNMYILTDNGAGSTAEALKISSSAITVDALSGTGTQFIQANSSGVLSRSSLSISGTNTGDQNIFQTISVSGQTDVVADTTTDTLTLANGTGIAITTNAGTDTITITAKQRFGVSGEDTSDTVDRAWSSSGKLAITAASTTGGSSAGVSISNSSTGTGLYVTSGGTVLEISGSGSANGIIANVVDGLGASLSVNPASRSTVVPMMQLSRRTSHASFGTTGIGGSIEFLLEDDAGFASASNSIITKFTTATNGAQTSQLIITGVNAGSSGNKFILNGNGSAQLLGYGGGTITGTAVYNLQVDASGNLIEGALGGGGGYTNLTQFVAQNNWKVFYSDGSGDVQELSIGAAGTFLGSNGTTSAPSFQNLADLTATDSTLTFSGTYNGATARTIGLNLGNANTWTALQTFNQTALAKGN